MRSTSALIYQDIASKTNGNIYIGVVGPVRTGKSTFVKKVMETFVIPKIDNIYRRERAIDELPQSGSGKTIMTSEPKFVPEEAVEISPDNISKFSIRLIDSVGYMIPGALGADENGEPRMVTTPWYPEEIPMVQAAELGTKKIMDEHCTIGIVMTTDGTIHDIPRNDFIDAESRAITDMKATGKPFLVLVNSTAPNSESAQAIKENLEREFHVKCLCMNCLLMQEQDIQNILSAVLQEFPLSEIRIFLPDWFQNLSADHPMKADLYAALLNNASQISSLREAATCMESFLQQDYVETVHLREMNPGSGTLEFDIQIKDGVFYQVLSENSGFSIESDTDLMVLLNKLAEINRKYEKVSSALEQVCSSGYGMVLPTPDEMTLEQPEIVRKGSNYAVRLKAKAPSIHMMRADIETEIHPMIGEEKQSEDMLHYLAEQSQGDAEKLWNAKIFGKSIAELVNEALSYKINRVSESSRHKFQSTLAKIVNGGSNGLICIIIP